MVRTFFFLILLVTFGCTYTQQEATTMTKPTSQEGKDCVRECEAINANCVEACSRGAGMRPDPQRKQICLNSCSKKLGDCYSFCEQL